MFGKYYKKGHTTKYNPICQKLIQEKLRHEETFRTFEANNSCEYWMKHSNKSNIKELDMKQQIFG